MHGCVAYSTICKTSYTCNYVVFWMTVEGYTNFITGYGTLKILRLGGNMFGDNGMQMIMEIFQSDNTLADLAVWSCNLSSKGMMCVAKWFICKGKKEKLSSSSGYLAKSMVVKS